MHLHGPMEGRRHDWTLFLQSEIDEYMEMLLCVDGLQYAMYGDAGYRTRLFLDTPFSGSNLSDIEKAFNKAMARSMSDSRVVFQRSEALLELCRLQAKNENERACGWNYLCCGRFTHEHAKLNLPEQHIPVL